MQKIEENFLPTTNPLSARDADLYNFPNSREFSSHFLKKKVIFPIFFLTHRSTDFFSSAADLFLFDVFQCILCRLTAKMC